MQLQCWLKLTNIDPRDKDTPRARQAVKLIEHMLMTAVEEFNALNNEPTNTNKSKGKKT